MKITVLIAVAALGTAGNALAQSSPMAAPSTPNGALNSGDVVVPHHAISGDGMPPGVHHRHCRTVYRHHHRLRRCT